MRIRWSIITAAAAAATFALPQFAQAQTPVALGGQVSESPGGAASSGGPQRLQLPAGGSAAGQ